MVAYTTPAILLYHESAQSPEGISDSARIAIGVVVPVVVLLAAIIGIVFWLRRRKRKQQLDRGGSGKSFAATIKEQDDDQQHAAPNNGKNESNNHPALLKPELDGSDASRRLLGQTKPELAGSYPPFRPAAETSELADTSIETAPLRVGRPHDP